MERDFERDSLQYSYIGTRLIEMKIIWEEDIWIFVMSDNY